VRALTNAEHMSGLMPPTWFPGCAPAPDDTDSARGYAFPAAETRDSALSRETSLAKGRSSRSPGRLEQTAGGFWYFGPICHRGQRRTRRNTAPHRSRDTGPPSILTVDKDPRPDRHPCLIVRPPAVPKAFQGKYRMSNPRVAGLRAGRGKCRWHTERPLLNRLMRAWQNGAGSAERLRRSTWIVCDSA
jgi:hypothetical protein